MNSVPTKSLAETINVPRDEVERLVNLLKYQAHPHPSPHAAFWQGLLDNPSTQGQRKPGPWIVWAGVGCPVDADATVEYTTRGNPQHVCRPAAACTLDWRIDPRPSKRRSNIDKYRVVTKPPAPIAAVLSERSAKDYAVEHAEYMATSADHVLAEYQTYGLALLAVDEGGDDGEVELFEAVDSARQDLQEALVTLRSRVYEFRKRRDRIDAVASDAEA